MRQQTVSTSLLSVKKNTNTIKWLFSIKMFQQQKNTPQHCRNHFKKHKGHFIPKNLQVIPKDTTVCTYIPICPIM